MTEKFNNDLVSAYLDGQLTDSELARVQSLLDDDPECREQLAQFRSMGNSMKSLQLVAPPELFDHVMKSIADETPSPTPDHPRVASRRQDTGAGAAGFNRWVLAISSLAALVLVAFFLMMPPRVAPNVAMTGEAMPAPGNAPSSDAGALADRMAADRMAAQPERDENFMVVDAEKPDLIAKGGPEPGKRFEMDPSRAMEKSIDARASRGGGLDSALEMRSKEAESQMDSAAAQMINVDSALESRSRMPQTGVFRMGAAAVELSFDETWLIDLPESENEQLRTLLTANNLISVDAKQVANDDLQHAKRSADEGPTSPPLQFYYATVDVDELDTTLKSLSNYAKVTELAVAEPLRAESFQGELDGDVNPDDLLHRAEGEPAVDVDAVKKPMARQSADLVLRQEEARLSLSDRPQQYLALQEQEAASVNRALIDNQMIPAELLPALDSDGNARDDIAMKVPSPDPGEVPIGGGLEGQGSGGKSAPGGLGGIQPQPSETIVDHGLGNRANLVDLGPQNLRVESLAGQLLLANPISKSGEVEAARQQIAGEITANEDSAAIQSDPGNREAPGGVASALAFEELSQKAENVVEIERAIQAEDKDMFPEADFGNSAQLNRWLAVRRGQLPERDFKNNAEQLSRKINVLLVLRQQPSSLPVVPGESENSESGAALPGKK